LLEGESQNSFLKLMKSNVMIANSNIESLVKIDAKYSDLQVINSTFLNSDQSIFEVELSQLNLSNWDNFIVSSNRHYFVLIEAIKCQH